MNRTPLTNHPAGRASVHILAAGVVVGFCYWASSVVITLLLSVLLAYFLDPLVEGLERLHVHRILGSLLAVLIMLALIGGLGWIFWDRLTHFAEDWPKYEGVLRDAIAGVRERIEAFERHVSELASQRPSGRPIVQLEDRPSSLLLRGLGSLYVFLLAVSFLPFLVFFMLVYKHRLWHATLQLFPASERTRVKHALDDINAMLRGFVVGNVLVAVILGLVTSLFFWLLGLDYPVLTGIASGFLNLVPYLGVVLAWIPPLIIGLAQLKSWWMFFTVIGVLSFFHLIAVNVLVPALVGHKVHLNALAATVALLFWGWLWGGLGLILAIPITATVKVICDHVEPWRPIGRWLGA